MQHIMYESGHSISCKIPCVPCEDLDPHSLFKVFARFCVADNGQKRLQADSEEYNVQTDPSLPGRTCNLKGSAVAGLYYLLICLL